jgi:hypothetical protein
MQVRPPVISPVKNMGIKLVPFIYIFALLRVSELVTTEIELNAIAIEAKIGFKNI